MNVLILIAVLSGPPQYPTIRISSGGEELVIRKLSPRVDVSIRSTPSDNLERVVIPWGDLFVEFEAKRRYAERVAESRAQYKRFVVAVGRIASYRDTPNPVTPGAMEDLRKKLDAVRRCDQRLAALERVSVVSPSVSEENGVWEVRVGRELLADVVMGGKAP